MTDAPSSAGPHLDQVIVAPVRALGEHFKVRRALPTAKRRMVGPFIFVDHMGPTIFSAHQGLDVLPHPHIGLATVTYLWAGEIVHRDSLGHVQTIAPGAVNLMTAGRGIVHSERTSPARRAAGGLVHGLQTWLALPAAHEEMAPAFVHHAAEDIPAYQDATLSLRVVCGELEGLRSPVETLSDTLFVDLRLARGGQLTVPAQYTERAAYVVEGSVTVAGQTGTHEAGTLLVFKPGSPITLRAPQGAHVMLVGGEPLAEPRYIDWNFVSSRKERLIQAKSDWRAQRFDAVPHETTFIPLPANPEAVHYP